MAKPALIPLHTVYKVVAAWSHARTSKDGAVTITIDIDDLPPGWPNRGKPEKVTITARRTDTRGHFDAAVSPPQINIRDDLSIERVEGCAHHELLHFCQWLAGQVGIAPKRGGGYLSQRLEPEATLSRTEAARVTPDLPHSRRPEEFFPNLYSDVEYIARQLIDHPEPRKAARTLVLKEARTRFPEWIIGMTPVDIARYDRKKARYVGALLAALEERLNLYALPNPLHRRAPPAYGAALADIEQFGDFKEAVVKGENSLRTASSAVARLRADFLHATAMAAFYKAEIPARTQDLKTCKTDLSDAQKHYMALQVRYDALRTKYTSLCHAHDLLTRGKAQTIADAVRQYTDAEERYTALKKQYDLLQNQVRQLRTNLDQAQRAAGDLTSLSAAQRKRQQREREAALRAQSTQRKKGR